MTRLTGARMTVLAQLKVGYASLIPTTAKALTLEDFVEAQPTESVAKVFRQTIE